MSFDSSRFTFNSWNDFLGVVMQQGRVQNLVGDQTQALIQGESAPEVRANIDIASIGSCCIVLWRWKYTGKERECREKRRMHTQLH